MFHEQLDHVCHDRDEFDLSYQAEKQLVIALRVTKMMVARRSNYSTQVLDQAFRLLGNCCDNIVDVAKGGPQKRHAQRMAEQEVKRYGVPDSDDA